MPLNPYIPGELRRAEDRIQQKEENMFAFGEKKKEAAREDIRFGQEQKIAGRKEQMSQWEMEAAQRAKEMADEIGEPLKYLDYAGQVFEKSGGNIAVPFYVEAFARLGLTDKMSAAPTHATADPRDPNRVVFLDASGEPVLGPKGVITIPRRTSDAASQGPSNVQEWEYYNKLSPEDQKKYLDMKRQGYQVKDVGGVPSKVPLHGEQPPTPLSTLGREAEAGKTIKQAEEEGKVAGKGEFTPREERGRSQERLRFGLSELSQLLGRMKGMGALPGSDQEQGKHIVNYLFGTDPGQVVARAIGTEAQQYRDEWQTLRTLMTQIVRPILGITGREMDTPKEVDRIMRTFGSLTFDYRANFNNAVRALVIYADMTKPEAEAFVEENFSPAAAAASAGAGDQAGAPQPRARKVVGGVTYEHDGVGWYPVSGTQ
jgi:hypothetical protein